MTASLAGRVAVITGAAGALGEAYARLLAAEGARLLVNDVGSDGAGSGRSSGPAEALAASITAQGGVAEASTHDVVTEGAAIVEAAVERFGTVDLLVNNAGFANGGNFDEIPPAAFSEVLDVHLEGTIAVTRAAWPLFREKGFGRVVNTSSNSVFGLSHSSAYVTGKAGVIGLTRALAQEGAAMGVKVNAVMPAAYSRLTAKHPRFAALMEAAFPASAIAPFVAALLTEEVPCTGETFVVGGGRAARVVLGTTPGVTGIDTPEAALDQLGAIMDSGEIEIPPDTAAEVLYECAQLGVDAAALGAGAAPS